jgi:putative membrane-bound dehydrogenase-like protein
MSKLTLTAACLSALLSLTNCRTNNDQQAAIADRDSAYKKLSDEEKRLPKNALAGIEIADGLEATLFASEPMIGNPTNIDIDFKGRVWMCEAFNYRPKLNPDNPTKDEGDRIVILEDTDGDGKADSTKVFYQGTDVNAALGIAVLGNKVIVSCSPNVFVFTDDNGDDVPDRKEVLFTHVGGEQHDHAIHAFTFGADGKLYFNFGNAGEQLMDKNGKLIKDKDGNLITNKGEPYRQGMVFRMNVDGSDVEVVAHNFRNNYEAATDAYGTIWQSDNDDDGNQSTRINYVMEYGNYGYTDEMTGAGWRSRRTNMETDIPKRHWHQSDPGTIPNLLPTGAGSPAGMAVYEGSLLPAVYQNQMIHAEAGNNIVRAYPVQKDGAGYKAEIKPIMEGTRDQWFRPIDVCAAPDGSLFVADWYDPGVGGHQMGDMNRGRIYRLSPKAGGYKTIKPDLSNAEGATQALLSANGATRYLAWQKLHSLGEQAIPALQKLWASDNSRSRARALWLLARIPGKEDQYIQNALRDKDPDIRITAIRAARQLRPNVIPYVSIVVKDADPQVRREAAIALHHNKSPEAAALWTELAIRYDGKDRWYLEALGIGADKQWDSFLNTWKNKASEQMNNQSGRDIVWRARTGVALPILATNISNESTSSADRLRYFRAFDFIEAPNKETVLLGLLDNTGANRNEIVLKALNHLSASSLAKSPKMKAALTEALASAKGTQNFVDLVGRYKLKDQNPELLQIALAMPDSSLGGEAASLLLAAGGSSLLKEAINSKDSLISAAALKTLSRGGNNESKQMMETVIMDKSFNMAMRQQAVKMWAGGWSESERLLKMIKEDRLPKELEATAAAGLSATYRKDIRQEALKYLQVANTAGPALPPINTLAKMTGDAGAGKQVFSKICSTCHQVGNEGAAFGPALTKIGSKLGKDALYLAIIHPDNGISFGYEGYVFKLKDGNTVAGIIASETEDAIEIVTPGGTKKKYEKAQLLSRKIMENSMMPSNLHQAISQQELVNLVEFLHAQQEKAVVVNK